MSGVLGEARLSVTPPHGSPFEIESTDETAVHVVLGQRPLARSPIATVTTNLLRFDARVANTAFTFSRSVSLADGMLEIRGLSDFRIFDLQQTGSRVMGHLGGTVQIPQIEIPCDALALTDAWQPLSANPDIARDRVDELPVLREMHSIRRSLVFRSEPNTSTALVVNGTLGQTFEVLEERDGWVRVRHYVGGHSRLLGWMPRSALRSSRPDLLGLGHLGTIAHGGGGGCGTDIRNEYEGPARLRSGAQIYASERAHEAWATTLRASTVMVSVVPGSSRITVRNIETVRGDCWSFWVDRADLEVGDYDRRGLHLRLSQDGGTLAAIVVEAIPENLTGYASGLRVGDRIVALHVFDPEDGTTTAYSVAISTLFEHVLHTVVQGGARLEVVRNAQVLEFSINVDGTCSRQGPVCFTPCVPFQRPTHCEL